jgi:hypothetical protein
VCVRYFIGTAGLVSGTQEIGLVRGSSRTPLTVRAYRLCVRYFIGTAGLVRVA